MPVKRRFFLIGAVMTPLFARQAFAADPLKIGMVTTLSTAGGYLGEDVRDGFTLAMSEEGGKLGGIPVQLLVEDDGLKPANGKAIAEKFLQQDKIKLLTGIIYSNVAIATMPTILESGAFYISPNAAPSALAGRSCNKNYFVASWQNDNLFEATGQYATTIGFKRMIALAPNYAAGKDAITGFKRYYRGEVIEDIFTSLDQTDYAGEIARIRAANPEAIFYFLPGGLGINFLKQFAQSGLKDKIKIVLPEVSLESRILEAVGDAGLGVYGTAHWVEDLPYPANKRFVAGFRARYKRTPTPYASQGYDTAKLIGSALRVVNGDISKADEFRAALRRADFQSTRGAFKFGPSQHPIEDWYSTQVVKGRDGKLTIRTIGRIMKNNSNVYAAECKL